MAQKLNHKERRPLEEIQQYREIGTVEGCREAVEKKTAKKIENWNGQISCPNCKVLYGNVSKIKLKPCPFCGGEATFDCDRIAGIYCVKCTNCKCMTTFQFDFGEGEEVSKKKAADVWNRRTGNEIVEKGGTE